MYLNTEPAGQPGKEKKLSQLLREGIPHVREVPAAWLENFHGKNFVGCAVGTMAYAAGARDTMEVISWATHNLGPSLYSRISTMNMAGCSREAIADWLESDGR